MRRRAAGEAIYRMAHVAKPKVIANVSTSPKSTTAAIAPPQGRLKKAPTAAPHGATKQGNPSISLAKNSRSESYLSSVKKSQRAKAQITATKVISTSSHVKVNLWFGFAADTDSRGRLSDGESSQLSR